ncbi:MAG: cell division protein FtsZ [Thermoplasmata archaeon]|nr:cell division protein FtsZ [Thermoplasmata archaeon]
MPLKSIKKELEDSEEREKNHRKLAQLLEEPGTEDEELEEMLRHMKTRILIVGCGGAGNNTVDRCKSRKLDENVKIVGVNTDAQHLLRISADKKILVGRKLTRGLGAGADPKRGKAAALENKDELRAIVEGQDMVFVTCGLGGGTGSGGAPVVAQFAKEQGALTLAIVSYPFSSEGNQRMGNADYGLAELRKVTDTVIVVPNDKLLETVPRLPLAQAFMVADEILMRSIYGITDLLNETELVNVDFADLTTIMSDGGVAMIGIGEASGENKAFDAVDEALNSPLLEVKIDNATGALVNVMGGPDMTVNDAQRVVAEVQKRVHHNANIIWGTGIRDDLENTVRVMIVVTGVVSDQIYGRGTMISRIQAGEEAEGSTIPWI